MPAKARNEAAEPAVKMSPAPPHASHVCPDCGQFELHPSTTSFTCEHGTWAFAPEVAEREPEASPEDARAALLASLDEDELKALLAAKAEGSQQ